jgi:DNA polymerase elongation subunit (family B)
VIDCVHNNKGDSSQEVVEIINNKDIIGLVYTLEDSFCNVAVSSFITAYSRIHMDEFIRLLRAADIDVIYTDTDSIVCIFRHGII